MKSAFIAICGADGSGKSLQARIVAEVLREAGITVALTAEPTAFAGDTMPTAFGPTIRAALRHEVTVHDPRALQLAYAADRLEHAATVILPALERGEVVITDRYDLSTLVYGMAKVPVYRCAKCGWNGDDPQWSRSHPVCPACHVHVESSRLRMATWLREVGRFAPRPTATIVLDVQPTVCAERRKARAGAAELFDDPVLQATVCALYRNAERWLPPGDMVVHVDGAGRAELVTQRLMAVVSRILDLPRDLAMTIPDYG